MTITFYAKTIAGRDTGPNFAPMNAAAVLCSMGLLAPGENPYTVGEIAPARFRRACMLALNTRRPDRSAEPAVHIGGRIYIHELTGDDIRERVQKLQTWLDGVTNPTVIWWL